MVRLHIYYYNFYYMASCLFAVVQFHIILMMIFHQTVHCFRYLLGLQYKLPIGCNFLPSLWTRYINMYSMRWKCNEHEWNYKYGFNEKTINSIGKQWLLLYVKRNAMKSDWNFRVLFWFQWSCWKSKYEVYWTILMNVVMPSTIDIKTIRRLVLIGLAP